MSIRTVPLRKLMLLAGVTVALAAIVTAIVFAGHENLYANSDRALSGEYFSRADAWNSLGGTWTADAAQVQNSSEERGAKLIAHTGEWGDFQIEADLQITEPFAVAGFILRSNSEEEGVDSYHGYFAGVRTMDSSIEFGRADYGWHSMAHASFPKNANPQGWLHLHAVAVGCRFGLEVRSPDGDTTSLLVNDAQCIRSGHFGLRSSFTSATWKNLRTSTASEANIRAIEDGAKRAVPAHDLLLTEPSSPAGIERFIVSMRDEAAKREVQSGVTPISYFRLLPGAHPNATIQGEIISLPPLADIQDNTGTIIVPGIDPGTPLKLGDVVEAQGTLISEQFRSRLENAKLRVLWSDVPVPPLAVTAAQLTGGTYRGRFIEVEGTLVSARHLDGGYELVLQDGDQTFRAFGRNDFRFDPVAFEPGSRLRVRGNATSLDQFTHGIYPFTVVTDRVDVLSAPPWWSPIHVLWLILACVVLLICLQWVLHRVQAWHIRLRLTEREELAFEMHDTLAQNFTGIAYQLQAAAAEKRGLQQMHAHIQNALKMVEMSHREASRTIASLRPQYRKASDILAALKELAERLSDGGPLRTKTHVEGKDIELPLTIADALFRVGQEAVTNAVQHANSQNLDIALELSRREIRFTVRDDGQGIASGAQPHGLGIEGMKNRAAKVGARFDLATEPFGGTSVMMTVPLQRSRGFAAGALTRLRTSFIRRYIHG